MDNTEQKIEVSDCQQRVGIFKKVPASELSLDDDFLNYTPKTMGERQFLKEVWNVIEAGVSDFWRPVYDPSIDNNGHICYVPGNMPAVGKSYEWWEENAKNYAPQCGSRLGTKHEYIAFLAVLIKEVIASGKPVYWAWNQVCNCSTELGYYWNECSFGRSTSGYEPTGSRKICDWYDLGNTHKFLAEDKENGGVWIAGGLNDYHCEFCPGPLASLYRYGRKWFENNNTCCGWLVFDSCPNC